MKIHPTFMLAVEELASRKRTIRQQQEEIQLLNNLVKAYWNATPDDADPNSALGKAELELAEFREKNRHKNKLTI